VSDYLSYLTPNFSKCKLNHIIANYYSLFILFKNVY